MQPYPMTTRGTKRKLAALGVKYPDRAIVEVVARHAKTIDRKGGGVIHYWEMKYGNRKIRTAVSVCAGVPAENYAKTFAQAIE